MRVLRQELLILFFAILFDKHYMQINQFPGKIEGGKISIYENTDLVQNKLFDYEKDTLGVLNQQMKTLYFDDVLIVVHRMVISLY